MNGIDDRLPQWALKQLEENRRKWSLEYRLYSLRARLIPTIFRHLWFQPYDRNLWQLDHRFSIYAGFNSRVPLRVISGRQNLQLIDKVANANKSKSCSITLAELYAAYIPDPQVNAIEKNILATDDDYTLWQWSLFAHSYMASDGLSTIHDN